MGGRGQRAQDLRELAGGELARSTGAVAELREATGRHGASLRPGPETAGARVRHAVPGPVDAAPPLTRGPTPRAVVEPGEPVHGMRVEQQVSATGRRP